MESLGYHIFLWTLYLISLYVSIYWLLVLLEPKKEKKTRVKKWPKVTIIIPAYNEEGRISHTIDAVKHLDYPKNKLNVVIINDASTDNTLMEIKKSIKGMKNVIVINNKKNIGKAASMNKALSIINTPFFVTLDADSYPERDALKHLVRKYYSEPQNLAAVTSRIRIDRYNSHLGKLQWIEYNLMMLSTRIFNRINAQYVTPGPFSLFKTDIIKKINGFDTRNLTEDQEIAYRLHLYGYRITFCKESNVYTVPMERFKNYYKQRNRWSKGTFINAIKYKHLAFNKRYGDLGLIVLPLNLLTIVFSLSITYSFYRFILKPIWRFLWKLIVVKMDILTLLKSFNPEFSILNIDAQSLFFILLFLSITITMLIIAFLEYKESIKEMGLFHLILFITVYSYIRSGIYIVSILELITGKIQRW